MSLPTRLAGRRRLEMHPARQGVPEIVLLGRYNHTRAETALPEHTHGDLLEICFLVKGRQTYRVGGRNYQLKGGDVFVAFPRERHSTAGNPQEKGVLYWIILRRKGARFLGLSQSQSTKLWESLCRLPSRHFPGTRKMGDHLNTLASLYHGPAFSLRPTFLASETLAFLLEVLKSARGEPSRPAPSMQGLDAYILAHLEEPLPVPDLAAQAGLSTARFKARFKEEMGIPPGEYVMRARLLEADKRLKEGRESVTQVAYGLGFSSSQYFATVFKRYTGKSPSAILPSSQKAS